MFDIGFSELLLIAIVALVVIGPERLPGVARNIGRFLGRLQRYVNDIKSDFNREIEFEEIRRLQQEMESTVQSMQESVRAVEASLQQEVKPREEVLATTLEEAQQKLDSLRAEVARLGGAAEVSSSEAVESAQPAQPTDAKPAVRKPRISKKQTTAETVSTEAHAAPAMPAQTVPVPPGEDQFRLF